MDFDVVITTCNRYGSLALLMQDICNCSLTPRQVIVVDASDDVTPIEEIGIPVVHVQSKHKNQPFQRYLGARLVKGDVVCFLDDDVRILDRTMFDDVIRVYEQEKKVVGVGVGIDYKNSISDFGEARSVPVSGKWFRYFNAFTGVHIPARGRLAKAGIAGGQLVEDGAVEYFNGPMMSFRRAIVLDLFDSRLFSAYEFKLGKGEDKYISMAACRYGILYGLARKYLSHPSNDSHYFSGLESFHIRVIFSRWMLSARLAQARGDRILPYVIHFAWFAGWRLVISFLTAILRYNRDTRLTLSGQLKGVYLLLFKYRRLITHNDRRWIHSAQ